MVGTWMSVYPRFEHESGSRAGFTGDERDGTRFAPRSACGVPVLLTVAVEATYDKRRELRGTDHDRPAKRGKLCRVSRHVLATIGAIYVRTIYQEKGPGDLESASSGCNRRGSDGTVVLSRENRTRGGAG